MPFDLYIEKALLDWCTGAASVTRPTNRFLGFESGSPRYSSDSPAQVFRSTVSFQAANSGVSASASLGQSVSASCSTTCTVFGWALFNSTSGGTRLVYGTLTATQTLRAGSQVAFRASNLVISLA